MQQCFRATISWAGHRHKRCDVSASWTPWYELPSVPGRRFGWLYDLAAVIILSGLWYCDIPQRHAAVLTYWLVDPWLSCLVDPWLSCLVDPWLSCILTLSCTNVRTLTVGDYCQDIYYLHLGSVTNIQSWAIQSEFIGKQNMRNIIKKNTKLEK